MPGPDVPRPPRDETAHAQENGGGSPEVTQKQAGESRLRAGARKLIDRIIHRRKKGDTPGAIMRGLAEEQDQRVKPKDIEDRVPGARDEIEKELATEEADPDADAHSRLEKLARANSIDLDTTTDADDFPEEQESERVTTAKEIVIENKRFGLTVEQEEQFETKRAERNDNIQGTTDTLKELRRRVVEAQLGGQDHEEKFTFGPKKVLESSRDEVSTILDERMEAYLKSEEGAEDKKIVELHTIIENPNSLPKAEVARIAKELQMDWGGSMARVFRRKKSEQVQQLQRAAQAKLQIMDSKAFPDATGDSTAWVDASINDLPTEQLVEYGKSVDSTNEQVSKKTLSIEDTQKKMDTLLAVLDTSQQNEQNAHAAFIAAVQTADINALLSSLARGKVTKEQVLDRAAETSAIRDKVFGFVGSLERAVSALPSDREKQAKSASLVGVTYDEHETALLQSLQNEINELRTVLDMEPTDEDIPMLVAERVKENEKVFSEDRIDGADTLYWHFTPQARKIFADGSLRSGAHEDVQSLTGEHSGGVHFIKPGEWQVELDAKKYIGYASLDKSLDGNKPIEGVLGAAVVYPLNELVKVTPIRNERKQTTATGEHVANDATFRAADGSEQYGYSLDNAFIVPTGADTENVRSALLDAGYTPDWIAQHVVDVPYERDGINRMKRANEEIKQRMGAQASPDVVVPMTSKFGQVETLDVSGGASPDIEFLTTVSVEDSTTVGDHR